MDSVFIEHSFKLIVGAAITIIGWFMSRTVKAHDDEIQGIKTTAKKVREDVEELKAGNIEIAKMSVKLDMVIQASDKTNKALVSFAEKNSGSVERLNDRLQGAELALARIGGKRKDD